MMRDIDFKELLDYRTGQTVGIAITMGCKTFFVDNDEQARKLVVAYANDPEGFENEFYAREERRQMERQRDKEQAWMLDHQNQEKRIDPPPPTPPEIRGTSARRGDGELQTPTVTRRGR